MFKGFLFVVETLVLVNDDICVFEGVSSVNEGIIKESIINDVTFVNHIYLRLFRTMLGHVMRKTYQRRETGPGIRRLRLPRVISFSLVTIYLYRGSLEVVRSRQWEHFPICRLLTFFHRIFWSLSTFHFHFPFCLSPRISNYHNFVIKIFLSRAPG